MEAQSQLKSEQRKSTRLESRNRNPRDFNFVGCLPAFSRLGSMLLCVYCILLQPLSYFTQLIDLLGEYKTALAAAVAWEVVAKWKQLFQIFPKAWRSSSLILLSLLLQHVDFHLWRVKKPRVKRSKKSLRIYQLQSILRKGSKSRNFSRFSCAYSTVHHRRCLVNE